MCPSCARLLHTPGGEDDEGRAPAPGRSTAPWQDEVVRARSAGGRPRRLPVHRRRRDRREPRLLLGPQGLAGGRLEGDRRDDPSGRAGRGRLGEAGRGGFEPGIRRYRRNRARPRDLPRRASPALPRPHRRGGGGDDGERWKLREQPVDGLPRQPVPRRRPARRPRPARHWGSRPGWPPCPQRWPAHAHGRTNSWWQVSAAR